MSMHMDPAGRPRSCLWVAALLSVTALGSARPEASPTDSDAQPSVEAPAGTESPAPAGTESPAPVTGTESAVTSADTESNPASQAEFKPRFELSIPSVHRLATETRRSHGGVFLAPVSGLLGGIAGASAEGVDAEQAEAVFTQIVQWPDTAVAAYTFASDTEGRARWAVRLDWPVYALYERVKTLLTAEATAALFEGVTLRPGDKNGYEVALADNTLVHLIPLDDGHACLSSDPDVPVPTEPRAGGSPAGDGEPPLLSARLNLTRTERDSGATFMSSFSAVTDLTYAGRVDEQGNWVEAIDVHWPPISGMGAKALFGKVRQTFYVPNEAFGAVALQAVMGPGMLDGFAGLGQQIVMEAPGQMTMVGEAGIGPMASSVEPEMCVTLLPGTGFLPMPDIVIQARTKRAKRLINELRESTRKLNEDFRRREQPEPWHEGAVADRTVFWSDGTSRYPGAVMPLVMRPVLFTTSEIDAAENERDFLVLGWTSTSPEAFVRRWLNLPRTKDKHYIPDQKKTDGQLWINWKQVYRWVSPWVNAPLGALFNQTPLPGPDAVASHMTDAFVTINMSYAGLSVEHRGPLPVGLLVVPSLFSASTATDEGGGSDLARERLACRQLKVLYHHAKLFKKDVGRWPAEVAELDGYVDFKGHPELLKLRLSSRKQWSEWFDGMLDTKKDKDEDEEADGADVFGDIDDEVYVIEWGRDHWRLKLAPNTLEHLDELSIDQDGQMHRKPKTGQTDRDKISESGKRGDRSVAESVLERAAQSIEHRYIAVGQPSESKKEYVP